MTLLKSSSLVLLCFCLVGLASGCAKDQSASDASLNKINAERDNFERQKDPPLNADSHFAAGQLAEAQGNPAMALQQYHEALKLDPKHQSTLYRLAVVHAELKQYDQAVSTWRKYIKVTEGSATGYSNLGFAYELAGNSVAAEDAYKKGIEKEPGNEPCRVNYGLMLARLNRFDEAKQQLSTVLSEAKVHYNLASVYEQQGRKDLARVEYKQALDLDPKLRDAETRLAAIQ